MRYIERDLIVVSPKYDTSLKEFKVSIRGTTHRDNIFFKQDDIFALLNLSSKIRPKDVAWIGTENDRALYISYDSLVELYRIKSRNGCSSTSKSFRFMFLINTILDDESCSELDDSEYSFSIDSQPDSDTYDTNGYLLELIREYKDTIDALAALLQIKDKTILRLQEENHQLQTQIQTAIMGNNNSNRKSYTSLSSSNASYESNSNSEEESEWV
jgi:hypothetical protein